MSARAVAIAREALDSRVAIIVAAAGWGKSTVAREALAGRMHRWIDLGSVADEPGMLVGELQRAFGDDLPEMGIVAIDDVHRIAGDPSSIDAIRSIVESRPRLHLLLVGRGELPLPTATWIASGVAAMPITEDDLALLKEDIRDALVQAGLPSDDSTVAAVSGFTQGWAVAVRFALLALRRSHQLERVEAISRDLAFKYLAEQIVGELDERQRGLLADLALIGPFDDATIAALVEEEPDELAAWLYTAGLPLHRAPEHIRLHDVFAAFLRANMAAAERAARAQRVAGVLVAREDDGRALDVLRFNAPDAVCAFLEERGLQLLQSGRRNSVKAAISLLPAKTRHDNPVILMLRASLEYGAGNFAQANALSDLAVERADADATFFADLVRARAILKLYSEREDAREWIERMMKSASEEVRQEMRGPYSILLAISGKADAARAEIDSVIREARRSDDARILARCYSWATSVGAYSGEYSRVVEYGREALVLHERNGDIRGTAIVWNTLAYAALAFSDDREQVERYAQAFHRAAKEWDDPASIKQAVALLYQLAVERGRDDALDVLEHKIADGDTAFPGSYHHIVTRAIHCGWNAGYHSALQLLATSHAHLSDPMEERCRQAALALFRALAGDHRGAARALAHVDQAHAPSNEVSVRVERFSSIYAAFAEVALGNHAAALARLPVSVRDDERAMVEACAHVAATPNVTGDALERACGVLERGGQTGFARLLRAAEPVLVRSPSRFGLTEAEFRVLSRLAVGRSSKQIADESGRSIETIRNQVKAVMRKMGVSSRLEAVAVAKGSGLV